MYKLAPFFFFAKRINVTRSVKLQTLSGLRSDTDAMALTTHKECS